MGFHSFKSIVLYQQHFVQFKEWNTIGNSHQNRRVRLSHPRKVRRPEHGKQLEVICKETIKVFVVKRLSLGKTPNHSLYVTVKHIVVVILVDTNLHGIK